MAGGTETNNAVPVGEGVRVDKWLWAARFYKTRVLAAAAVASGKVEVNNHRPKAARQVHIGDTLRIRRGAFEHVLTVTGLSRIRGPASMAARLYQETEESRRQRKFMAEQQRLTAAGAPRYGGRPEKRDRRHIVQFTRKRDWDS